MLLNHFFCFLLAIGLSINGLAQAAGDSTPLQLPGKYLDAIEKKTDKYYSRITRKTEKTLIRLARWEAKIHNILLKVNPETANRLFAPGQPSFAMLLQQYQQGKHTIQQYQGVYDEYRDRLNNTVKYVANSPEAKQAKALSQKLTNLDSTLRDNDAIQRFIKERKKQLTEQAMQYIGKSRLFKKMDKETYYYIETLRNYKELFSDEKKIEELAKRILQKIPGFDDFLQRNSVIAGLFGLPGGSSSAAAQSLAGLQTRASVNSLLQQRIAMGGPNAMQQIQSNMQAAQAQLNQLKDRIAANGGNSELPDFKPNNTKTKTFLQRIEYTANMQFGKANSLLPTTADVALGVGYKLNDKSTIGVGAGYKLGVGSIQRIRFTNQGISLRSYVDWKLKKQFYISGGYEMNYLPALSGTVANVPITGPQQLDAWQASGLIGIMKKINIKTKWIKGTRVQLLYDMLYRNHVPASQPFLFRVGYGLK